MTHTIKHQPATPLPWNDGDFYSDEYAVSQEDVEYGTHAANAYPKLVEALRGAIEECERAAFNVSYIEGDCAVSANLMHRAKEIRELLAEIEEKAA